MSGPITIYTRAISSRGPEAALLFENLRIEEMEVNFDYIYKLVWDAKYIGWFSIVLRSPYGS